MRSLLGLSVAFTHSIVVILLAVKGVWLGNEAFTDKAMYGLQIASGVIVILLGCYLLYRRWPRHSQPPAHHHEHDHSHATHHHAPDPFKFSNANTSGTITIIDTTEGERFCLELHSNATLLAATVRIMRANNDVEEHVLARQPNGLWISEKSPSEPHEFDAMLELKLEGERQEIVFHMSEPI